MGENKENTIIKLKADAKAGKYVRDVQNFLNGRPEKSDTDFPKYDTVTLSALGNAIILAANVLKILQKEQIAELVSIHTGYPTVEPGRSNRPQVLIKLKRGAKEGAGRGSGREKFPPPMHESVKGNVNLKDLQNQARADAASEGSKTKTFFKAVQAAGDPYLLLEYAKAPRDKMRDVTKVFCSERAVVVVLPSGSADGAKAGDLLEKLCPGVENLASVADKPPNLVWAFGKGSQDVSVDQLEQEAKAWLKDAGVAV